jgi:MFS family permease
MSQINKNQLFTASCVALTVTAMTFAIRAGLIGTLGEQFQLSNTDMSYITSMAFFGFPVATTLGGFFVDTLGMKKWMTLTFLAHLLGIVLTIFAGGFWTLFISTFLIGFANGMVEAVCNPLVASMYTENKTVMLNRFHVWFPGGIVIGALVATLMTKMGMGWQLQVASMLIPTFIYAYLFWGQEFPKTERVAAGVSMSSMLSACASPLFLFMMVCMFFTANAELATNQWVEPLLKGAGADPLLILALVNGIMAVLRFFGEPIIHKLSPAGVLLVSSILATLGVYLLGHTTGPTLYAAAIVFALGVCYFWPTMLGFVSEYIPKSGAMGLSLMGGMGMLGNAAYQSWFLGPKLDAEKAKGLSELAAGQSVLGSINILPVILVVAFAALFFFMKDKKHEGISAH